MGQIYLKLTQLTTENWGGGGGGGRGGSNFKQKRKYKFCLLTGLPQSQFIIYCY